MCDLVSSFPPYSFRRFMYFFLRLSVYFLNSKTDSKQDFLYTGLYTTRPRKLNLSFHVSIVSRDLNGAKSNPVTFLGAFAKLRKATISIVMYVRLPILMEQLGSYWTDFYGILYFRIFRKSVEKIQVSLKSDKNSGYFT
jgi:hypothetical protein